MYTRRAKRVGESIKREISSLIQREVKDPRVKWVTITRVKITNDLSFARVYVTIYGDEVVRENCLKGLASASGFIRRQVTRSLRLRIAPEINFHYDDDLERNFHLLRNLRELEEKEKG